MSRLVGDAFTSFRESLTTLIISLSLRNIMRWTIAAAAETNPVGCQFCLFAPLLLIPQQTFMGPRPGLWLTRPGDGCYCFHFLFTNDDVNLRQHVPRTRMHTHAHTGQFDHSQHTWFVNSRHASAPPHARYSRMFRDTLADSSGWCIYNTDVVKALTTEGPTPM